MRSNNCDKRMKEINDDIKVNKDTIEKAVQQETRDKKEIEDHIMKNNAEVIIDLMLIVFQKFIFFTDKARV